MVIYSVMKSYKSIAFCAVFCSAALVSCETSRVNERPLGSTPRPAFAGDNQMPNGNSLLDDIQGIAGGDPNANNAVDPAQQSNSGTISQLLNGINGGNQSPSVNQPNTNPINPPSVVPQNQPIVPPTPAPAASADIPTAWAIPGDPTIVRSPYDSTKKIRIVNKNGVRYPSGTVLRDTNFKNEVRKFRVP